MDNRLSKRQYKNSIMQGIPSITQRLGEKQKSDSALEENTLKTQRYSDSTMEENTSKMQRVSENQNKDNIIQRNTSSTYACNYFSITNISAEKLKEAMIWYEVLGRPVSRKRRKR